MHVSYSEKMGFVWCRVAKTGTRTLHQVLHDSVEDYVYVAGYKMTRREKEVVSNLLASGAFFFSCVRNPLDRLVSAWHDKIKKRYRSERWELGWRNRCRRLDASVSADAIAEWDFDFFVEKLAGSDLLARDIHFMPQSQILAPYKLDYLARFERYEHDILHILHRLALPISELPQKNATSHSRKNTKGNYPPRTKDIVAKLYAGDFEKYGYSGEKL